MKNAVIWSVYIIFLSLLLTAVPNGLHAQSGKLAGTIRDVNTNEPLPGVTILIVGTQQGAASNLDGRYDIIGITPGTYSVRFSSVGYATKVFEDVRIVSNRTFTLDVELSEQTIEGEAVYVEATRPVVDVTQTNSRAIYNGEELQNLPVANLEEVIATTSNSYKGFVRGSRRFETKTVVEGIDISDSYSEVTSFGGTPYNGLTYHSTNRSDKTDGSIVSLNTQSIEEVTVNTGAKDASYPGASGGVVAVTLAEKRGPIAGTASFRVAPKLRRPGPDSLSFYFDGEKYLEERQQLVATDDPKAALYTWSPDKYNTAEDPEMNFDFSIGGSVSEKFNFSASGQFFQTYGYEPNQFTRKVNAQIKGTYSFTPSTRLTAVGIYEDLGLWGGWNNRDYVDFWRFYLEGVAQNDGGSYVGSLKLTHSLTTTSFLEVQVYRTYTRSRYGYVDDDENGFTDIGEDGDFIDLTKASNIERYVGTGGDRDKMFLDRISDPFSDSGLFLPDGTRYKIARPVPYSEDRSNYTNGIKFNYANQILPNHYIQAGTELKLRNFDYEEVYGVDGINFTLNEALEPYIPRKWSRSPWELGFYASDRMEYADLIVNLGLRVEFVDRDTENIKDFFYPFRRDTITVDGRKLARNFFDRGNDVPIDVFFNPSIGVSHPIGTKASMYFSYARSQQLVPYSRLYSLYDGNHSNSPFFIYQDPAQDPIISNNYELGVQWEFLQGWGLDVNAFMRSIKNYGRTTMRANNRNPEGESTLAGNFHNFETSFGYADVRGIELVLRRRILKLAKDVGLGVTASYTFSSVEEARIAGVNQRDFDAPEDGSKPILPFQNAKDFKNFAQNVEGGNSTLTGGYDRTHRFILRAVSSLPYDISLGISSTFESGFLFPRAVGVDPRDRELLTAPSNFQIDFRLEKQFAFNPRFGLDVYLDVTNLTDRENIIAYESNTPSGPAIFQETENPGSRLILNDGTSVYGPARNIYFGTRFRF